MLLSSNESAPARADLEHLKSLRWTSEAAFEWQKQNGWLCGFNFLPSTAVNFIDMWHPATFDLNTIKRELGLAADIGYDALRTNLQFLLWDDDPADYQRRIDAFLDAADSSGIKVIFCLFDDCGFSGGPPDISVQPDPIPGIHNSRAMASPGREIVMDTGMYTRLKDYVQTIIGAYQNDSRVICWDIYNEPGNLMIFDQNGQSETSDALEPFSLELLIASFKWARACNPSQPLTTAAWHTKMPWDKAEVGMFEHEIDQIAIALSDIVSYHAYCSADVMSNIIKSLQSHGRPLLCTEWLARNIGSTIIEQLPILKREGVGAFQWGLVRGRTQTHIPWPGIISLLENYDLKTSDWFHDLINSNGEPFDPKEIALVKRLTDHAARKSTSRANAQHRDLKTD